MLTVIPFPAKSSSPTSLPALFGIDNLPTRAFKSLTLKIARPSAANQAPISARDIVISFGKHKGRMLGTLPSSYLKWVSSNLRAGDTELWAKLADQVLEDPFYRDRMEWEVAEKVLTGNGLRSGDGRNAVAELGEISERFGWDEDDKLGWSKIDWKLLGTSMGGRIPRRKGEIGELDGDGSVEDESRARRRQRRQRHERERIRYGEEKSDDGGKPKGAADAGKFPGRESLLKRLSQYQ